MSQNEEFHNDAISRFEPWLGVMASAVVPVVASLYLPGRFWLPLVIVTAALFLTSLVMLRRQSIRRRAQSAGSVERERVVTRRGGQ